MTKNLKKYIILIIPVLYLLWSLQINHSGGPFSLSRSDPEYPYLLNGLNCATLHFNNIGHTDHPGTPFQMVTGLFIRLTHLVIGQGPIVNDVIARPETYLFAASLFLSLLTFFLIWWLGKLVVRYDEKLIGALILQSSFFLSNVLIDMPLRYNPDRILLLFNLIFIGVTIKFLLSGNYPVKKYAIITGILMGIGFATKFNFLPVLIIPFLLIPDLRNKIIYGFTFLIAFFISILPILNKFKEFRKFISGVATHDGLYGAGSQQMINWKSFVHNFWELLSYNPAYTVILILSIFLIIWFLSGKREIKPDKRFIILLSGFVLASLIGFVLVLKHFKVYYFAPVLSLTGMAYYIIWKLSGLKVKSAKARSISGSLVLTFFILVSVLPLPAQYRSRVRQKQANDRTRQFYADNVTRKDLLFIEPTWLAGPMVENALAYGISYVAHRNNFYKEYSEVYPNVITWEGEGKTPTLFRTAEADPESILFCGSDLFIYSSPGRNAGQLVTYMDTIAARFGTHISRDTVFSNPENDEKVIRIRNLDSWKTLDNIEKLNDPFTLSQAVPVTESFTVSGISAGDYIEITLRIRNNDSDARCRIIARSEQSDQDGIYFEDSGSLQNIGKGWQLLRLRGNISKAPADGRIICQIYYPGKNKITVQDLQIRHMGRQ